MESLKRNVKGYICTKFCRLCCLLVAPKEDERFVAGLKQREPSVLNVLECRFPSFVYLLNLMQRCIFKVSSIRAMFLEQSMPVAINLTFSNDDLAESEPFGVI